MASNPRAYFEGRKLGAPLDPAREEQWWRHSKYRLCLRKFGPPAGTDRIVDLGCGLGTAAERLARHAAEVIAVDASAFAIEFARSRQAGENLRFVESDALAFHPEAVIDAVYCMDFLEHLTLDENAVLLERIRGYLRPGGALFVHVPIADSAAGRRKRDAQRSKHPDNRNALDHTGDPSHRSTFSVPSLTQLLADHGFGVAREWRKVDFMRGLRPLYGLALRLPVVSAARRDAATYSWLFEARVERAR